MIRLSQERGKTLLAIHGWSGIVLGLLLYAVIVTGVVAVFAGPIANWSSPRPAAAAMPFPPGLGAKLHELAAEAKPEYLEEITLFPYAGGRIRTFLHHHVVPEGETEPEDYGLQVELDPATLDVLERHEGWDDDIDAANTTSALADFLVELHVSLHIPDPFGLLVTGILGLAMMVASVTGFVVHRHLIRELFTLRRFRERLLVRRDAHVVAGTWNLPFAFVLAFTGSYFSFAGSIGIPAMAMVAFGGDQQALFDTVVGKPMAEDKTPAAFGDLDAMLADARRRTAAEPSFVVIEHYGRADAQVTVFSQPAEGQLTTHNLVYAGAGGTFLREKPTFGLVPSAGGTLAELMGPLHFGNFAGNPSKITWFSLGFASAYVALTGMLLWTTRRAESLAWRRMARFVAWVGYGLPLALAATPWGFLIGRASGASGIEPAMAGAFIGTAAVALAATLLVPDVERLRRGLLFATAVALAALPALRLAVGGPGWTAAVAAGFPEVPSIDAALLTGGAFCLWTALRRSTVAGRDAATARAATRTGSPA